jgi:hypothetical protein
MTCGGAVAFSQAGHGEVTAFARFRSPRRARRTRPPTVARRLINRQFMLTAPNVLHEGVSGGHDPGAAVLLESSHRMQPRLEAAVVGLDTVVGIPIGAMPGRRHQLLDHQRVVGARSVTTSTGCALVEPMARSKN